MSPKKRYFSIFHLICVREIGFYLFTSVFGVSFINCLPSAKDLLTGIVLLSRFMELNECQLAELTDEEISVIQDMGVYLLYLFKSTPGLGDQSLVFNVHTFCNHGVFWNVVLNGKLLLYSTEYPESCYGWMSRSSLNKAFQTGAAKGKDIFGIKNYKKITYVINLLW